MAGESEVTHSRSGINVGGDKVRGDAMQEAYKENQTRLHEHSSQGFGPQNELQRRVAEQRSENEHKINESAGEIGKNNPLFRHPVIFLRDNKTISKLNLVKANR